MQETYIGARCNVLDSGILLQLEVAGSIPDKAIGFFFTVYLIIPAALGPELDSASSRKHF
jgi:hypothetical protein